MSEFFKENKKLTYYEKNKHTIKKYYEKNKEAKAEYNKEYYQKIKKEKRQTWEYRQYQRNYYRLKKQGLRPSDIKNHNNKVVINDSEGINREIINNTFNKKKKKDSVEELIKI